jgi:apoptosis-inducing factor 2
MGNSATLPSDAKKVIVVGGGYAGTLAAKELDGICEVTLITPRNFLYHKYASLRANVVPGWEQAVCIPLDNLLRHGKIVNGLVISVREDGVTLEDGTELSADYIILANGFGSLNLPAATPNGIVDMESFKRVLVNKQQLLRQSNSIVIIGAGPVGLEMAGEIRSLYPSKSIKIIQSQPQILTNSTPPLIPKFINKVNSRMAELNIEVILNVKATNLPSINDNDGFITDLKTVQLSNGQSLATDLVLVCVGSHPTPNILDPRYLDEKNQVKVDLTFQVMGLNHVYCIGDASNIPETKLGYHAELHATHLVKNIKRVLKGKQPLQYTPASGAEFGTMFLPLGPNRGVAALNKTVLGDGMTSRIKSKGLFKKKVFESRNATAPVIG